MKKTFLAMTALAAMLFAGCTSSDEITTLESIKQAENAATPISFGTYMGKTGTRAGYEGVITNTELKLGKTLGSAGFGVFAVSSTAGYNSLTSRKPNFMYNEQIYYNSGWKYDNIKYWPNGQSSSTAADGSGATSTSTNKVSFFAYAPYVSESTTWASEAYGITSMSLNTADTNPKITYTLNNAHFIDLLWGTTGTNGSDVGSSTAQAGGAVNTDANGSSTSSATSYGTVNIDMTKQKINGTVNFLFKHALAQIGGYSATSYGGLSVIADIDDGVDETTPTIGTSSTAFGGTLDPNKTKVTITSITITPDKTDGTGDGVFDNAMPTIGVLDLATGSWTNTAPTNLTQLDFTHVINNNPSSGEYELATAIKSPTSISQWTDVSGVTGVLSTTPTNVYASAAATPLLLLPGTTPSFTFTIQYEVCTNDTKLQGNCSIVTQTITKTVTFGSPVQMNKRYNILIHLGLTGIKFDATVSDWNEDINGDSNVDANDTETVNLPINVL